ncbi:MAG: lysophospholipid acyltransferase family protein [Flavobacteriaceae bacterium]
MAKLLSYPLSVLYYLVFGGILVLFDGLQRITYLFGYQAHKICVDVLNFFLLRGLNLLGTRFVFDMPFALEKNQSYIIVANHQSTYDIPPLIWCFRKVHPKFVGKKELGKGIPSISFNLRNGGAVLIDRKNPKQALEKIKAFGERTAKAHRSAIIFPEGTRSRNHKPRPFRYAGLMQLAEVMPNAKLLGVSISNSWKITRYGSFPLGIGTKMILKVHPPIAIPKEDIADTLRQLEEKIKASVLA